jgi:hypothetical protein
MDLATFFSYVAAVVIGSTLSLVLWGLWFKIVNR